MTLPTPVSMRQFLLTALVAAALTQPVVAQVTIGAARTTSVGTFTGGPGGVRSIGQSFTVPTLAPALSSFSLSLTNAFDGANLRFSAYIYRFDAATRSLTGAAAWSRATVAGSGNDFSFDLRTFDTGNVLLAPGSTYLFLLTTLGEAVAFPEAGNLLGASTADGYAGGALWASDAATNAALFAGGWSQVDGVADLAFTATFTSATVVPEPATVVLVGTGLLALGGLARRRGRGAQG